MTPSVNQKGAAAHGDVVGGNKVTNTTTYNLDFRRSTTAGKIEALKQRLLQELQAQTCTPDLIERLQYYHVGKPAHDGIEGLEGKLRAAGRDHEIDGALEYKEMFAKLLEKFSLYASAQEIFVHLLSQALHEFRMSILPQLGALEIATCNAIITQKIVVPLVEEAGDGPLSMDALVAMGMYYWLAEQCFVRWHA
jgi:hypothetical protein